MKIMDAYRLLITPLSPIHIGTGESYEPTNYVIEDGTLYEFDTGAVVDALADSDRKELLAITSRRPDTGMIKAVQKYFHDRRATLQPWAVHRIPVLDGVARMYANRVGETANLETGGRQVINRLEIDRTACNPVNRQPVLFGSSIKGAIRTALLDGVNSGAALQSVEDRRTGKPRNENNLELQQRLFKYQAGKFELDPMRLVQLSDAAWRGEAELPTAQVFLAVNRKKALVTDGTGKLRQSQAETKQLYQILECVPPLRYRSFAGQLNVQSVAEIRSPSKLPNVDLQFDIARVGKGCNAFYRPILESEIRLLRERGYVSEGWVKSVETILRDPRLAEGSVFLLRVGRHSGAESVTLRGVRDIKIMLDRDPETGRQRSTSESESRTVWLAASERDQKTALLPFGWLLVEVAPFSREELADHALLKAACDEQLAAARQWAGALAAKQRAMDEARARAEARRREEAEMARQRAVAEAESARLEAERGARLAAMSDEEREVEGLRKLYEDEARRGVLKPGSATIGKLNELLKAADSWPAISCQSLAGLAEQIFGHKQVGWGSGDKRRERKARIAALRGRDARGDARGEQQ